MSEELRRKRRDRKKKGQRLCDQVSKRLVLGVDLKRGQGKIVGRLSRTCVCTFGHSLKSVSLRAGGIRLEETNSHLTVSQRFLFFFCFFSTGVSSSLSDV